MKRRIDVLILLINYDSNALKDVELLIFSFNFFRCYSADEDLNLDR